MNNLAHALLVFAAPLCLLAADFPEGTGAIEITEPGTYTATEDRTFESLVVATPTGTADARTVTVFDHTEVPERTITLTGAGNVQFNVANHYNDIWFKGGTWNFSKYFYLGNENKAEPGRDSFRRVYVTDGAKLAGPKGSRLYVTYGNGGNEFYVSNATVEVENAWVQFGSAMTTSYDPKNCGKLIVGENGKVSLTGILYVQGEYTSSNSRQTGAAYVSGSGAEVTAKDIQLGDAPLTRAIRGSEVVVDNGGQVTATGAIKLGMKPYTQNPALFDRLTVAGGTLSALNVYAGFGSNVVNEVAYFTNSTVEIMAKGSLASGFGVNSATNAIKFVGCSSEQIRMGNMVYAGYGEGSHDNLVGFYECGTVRPPTKVMWYSGRGAGSYRNTILFSNTVVRADYGAAAGGSETSVSNEVVFAGPRGKMELTLNQRDPISYGHYNRFRVTDRATLSIEDSSFWPFKTGYDSEIVIENGGMLTNGLGQTLSIVVGKVTGTLPNPPLVTSGNSLVFRNGGCGNVSGELQICGTNDALVVSDASIRIASHLSVGYQQQVTTSDKTVTNLVPSAGCRLVVAGTHPKITIDKNLKLIEGAQSVLRFEPVGDGFSWPDEPTRPAPVVLTSTSSYSFLSYDDAVFEADVSKLNSSQRDRPIPVVSCGRKMTISETALANANAKGALAKKPYRFSLSDDQKTLYLMAESKGLMLLLK